MEAERILLVHNRYRERGGEDAVYEAEGRLLESRGHTVWRHERDNREVPASGGAGTALRAFWSREDRRAVGDVVRRNRIQVVHVHNTLPLVSPSVYGAARKAGAAVVQTLHNFRLMCVNGLLLRDGAPCEACVGHGVAWRGIVHRCYRGSRGASAAVAATVAAHRALGTWHRQVDAYIALSRFARDRFVAGGLPARRITVRGGFVQGPFPDPAAAPERHFLYVGRLAEEKGVRLLLDAWRGLGDGAGHGAPPLRIVGDGPLRADVEAAAAGNPALRWLGALPRARVLEEMGRAWALVFPSVCYEHFPGVLGETRAMGLPVVASRVGSVAEVVEASGAGVLVPPGDAWALAAAVAALAADPSRRAALSAQARESYRTSLTPDHAYRTLLAVYRQAREWRSLAGP